MAQRIEVAADGQCGVAGRSSTHAMATPKQISRIPAQRVAFSCSPRNIFAPKAPATYARDVAGITKLTGNQESIVRKEKNDAVISSTPSQSHLTRSARMTKDTIARGRKSCTSPSSFIASVRQISPPVPVTTTKMRMGAVRMSARLYGFSGAVRRAVDQKNAQKNQKNSGPARGRNVFAQEQKSEQRHQRVRDRGKRHHETVIGPREHEHVADHEQQHERDAQPNRSARQNPHSARLQCRQMRNIQVAHIFHSLAQNRISNRAEEHEQEEKHVGLSLVRFGGSHFRHSACVASQWFPAILGLWVRASALT